MVVIVGAGVVGAATAYYLSASTSNSIQVLDAVGPAAGSSGRAGAFVTNQAPAISSRGGSDKRQSLFEASFDLHQQLAKELSLQSYRPVQNYQGISEDGSAMSLPGDAALVDPAELTNCLLEKALSNENCSFRQADVKSLETDSSEHRVTTISLEGGDAITIQEDEQVVICLGPWTCRIEDWLGIPMPIEGVLSTSLIYQDFISFEDVGVASFFEEDSNGCHLEVFGRHDQSLYVSGCGESQVLGTRDIRSKDSPSPQNCPPDMARAMAAQDSLESAGYFLERSNSKPDVQACIRPTSPDGVPVVGKILDNVYVATGGGPWGITWGPLMGKCLASLVADDDKLPIPIGPLSPRRFDTLIYQTLLKSRAPNSA